jgi:subtilisin-like proprotein convertase family protein
MRFSLFLLAVLGTGWPAFAAPLREVYRLSEGRQVQEFVVARDEVHRNRTPRRIPVARDAEGARIAAAAEAAELVLYPRDLPRTPENRRLLTRRIAVQLAPGVDPAAVAMRAGLLVASGPRAAGWYIFEAVGGAGAALEALPRLQNPDVTRVEVLLARQQQKRAVPNDPLLSDEWHLQPFLLTPPSFSANVVPAWQSATGAGVTLAIVDDGLQHSHPDLAPRYSPQDSSDFNGRDRDPEPPSYFGDDHGTSCAGVAAAAGNNGIGVTGVAFDATLAGLRLIAFPTTDEEEADAFAFKNDSIDIKSNSWGPPDTGGLLSGPGALSLAALKEGAKSGRGGLGTIFLFAAGNGAQRLDQSNFDGYANEPEVIAVGAVSSEGLLTPYAEPGANLLVSAPSSGGRLGIVTTDRVADDGYNINGRRGELPDLNYTNSFGGTSSACPLVAGVVALMLQANPQLGWRDVQEILIQTAREVPDRRVEWQTNGAGFRFSHAFGAGLVDAAAAVAKAGTWVNLAPQAIYETAQEGLATPIPDAFSEGVTFTFNVPTSNLRVEHAQLSVAIAHARRGQLEITLTSPFGTVSHLAEPRPLDKGANYFWSFMSTHHWGEMAAGDWKVRIVDRKRGAIGVVQELKLTLSGSAPRGLLSTTGLTDRMTGAQVRSIPADGVFEADVPVTNVSDRIIPLVQASFLAVQQANVGVSNPDLGNFAPGETKNVRVQIQPLAPIGTELRLTLRLESNGKILQDLPLRVVVGNLGTASFESSEPLQIPAFRNSRGSGTASQYPSIINVTDLPAGAVIVDVKLRLSHLTHQRVADLDALLVSPGGAAMVPFSDCGFDSPDIDLTLSDSAQLAVPETASLSTGAYRPANYGATIDRFPGFSPGNQRGFGFSTFRGSDPSGEWQLKLVDDRAGAVGSLRSWSLEITYAH